MKPTIFVAILLFPVAFAMDCSQFPNPSECQEIMSSELNSSEKDYILSDLLSPSKNYPPHSFVKEWNLALDLTEQPEGVRKYSKEYIKNAWVKLYTVMPSVMEGGLCISSSGEMLAGYGHDFQMPHGTWPGDCDTQYLYEGSSVSLDGYVNGRYAGSGKVIPYTVSEDSEFKVVYRIKESFSIRHYKKEKVCCKTKNYVCISWCRKCGYKNTEHIEETLSISDSLSAKYADYQMNASFTAIDSYLGNVKGVLNSSNHSSLHLKLDTGNYSAYNYAYTTTWDNSSILTVKVDRIPHSDINSLIFDNKSFLARDPQTCGITLFSHFSNRSLGCDLDFEKITPIIRTDKRSYEAGEDILVSLSPSQYFNLTYGNKSYLVKDHFLLTASPSVNRISIFYNERNYDTLVRVTDKDNSPLLLSLAVFGSANYIIAELLKRYLEMHP